VFCVLVALYCIGNQFSIYEHWDEAGKAAQIISGQWNFSHPQLLLSTTRLLMILAGGAAAPHDIVVAGRWCSAIFAAGAAVLLSILARRLYGDIAGYVTAILIGTGAHLFGLAHYMKEDTALLFGIAAFLLALDRFLQKPSWQSAATLGIGCGLASAGKYIGLVTIIFGLIAVQLAGKRELARLGAWSLTFIAASVLVFIAANIPALENFHALESAFLQEVKHVTTSHLDLVSPIWDPMMMNSVLYFCGPLALAGIGFAFWALIKWRFEHPTISIISAFLLVLWLMIQCSTVKAERYSLPLVVTVQFLSICSIIHLWRVGPDPATRTVVLLLIGIAGAWNSVQLGDVLRDVFHGSRQQLVAWLVTNVPPSAKIAADRLLSLNTDDPNSPRVPQTVLTRGPVDALGSLDELRSSGVRYVIITDTFYPRFFSPALRTIDTPEGHAYVDTTRKFYEELLNTRNVLTISGSGNRGVYFSPKIAVFDIQSRP
jgi:4-amino-4-deoxy-L-arabinose transferase-like glycosyltransferase